MKRHDKPTRSNPNPPTSGGELRMNYTNFHRLMKNKWALSTVVTTLIILVISVLLASVVTYFAINVVSTRVQEESLALTKQHLYHNSTAATSLSKLRARNLNGYQHWRSRHRHRQTSRPRTRMQLARPSHQQNRTLLRHNRLSILRPTLRLRLQPNRNRPSR